MDDSIVSKQFTDRLEVENDKLSLMMERANYAKEAIVLCEDNSSGNWIHGSTLFGITTHYRLSPDGLIYLRMESEKEDLPLFEQLAVMYEFELYKNWIPFFDDSQLLLKLAEADIISYFNVTVPLVSRDFALHGYGVDCLYENGCIVLAGKSIEAHPNVEIPFRATGWLQDRLVIKDLYCVFRVISPTSTKITIIACVDPKAPLPQVIVNFIMKKAAGLALYLLQSQAKKVVDDPGCEHGRRMRANTAFYSDWLLRKYRAYCADKQWEQPVIAALGDLGLPPANGQSSRIDTTTAESESSGDKVSEQLIIASPVS